MSEENPWNGGDAYGSTTIKVSRDEPWTVAHGKTPEAVKNWLIGFFGLGEEAQDMTPAEVMVECQTLATAMSTVATKAGGRPVGHKGSNSGKWEKAREGGSSQPAKPEKSEEEVERERLSAAIASATSTDDLRQLWARNQDAFKDESLMAEWKAKGKSLE